MIQYETLNFVTFQQMKCTLSYSSHFELNFTKGTPIDIIRELALVWDKLLRPARVNGELWLLYGSHWCL